MCDDMSTVTLVGNGPLNDADRDAINKSACVIRFNDMKNMEKGDKVDGVAVRDNTLHLLLEEQPVYKHCGFLGIWKTPTTCASDGPVFTCGTFGKAKEAPCLRHAFDLPDNLPILPVLALRSSLPKLDKTVNLLDPIIVHEKEVGRKNIIQDKDLFSHCHKHTHHSTTEHGPSTGAAVIDALEHLDAVKQIEVYGMNWTGHAWVHVDFKDPTLVQECCSKCNIHDTKGNAY